MPLRSFRLSVIAMACCALLVAGRGQQARAEDELPKATYQAELTVPEGQSEPLSSDVRALLAPQSRLLRLQDDPPATLFALHRRAEDDASHLLDVLHSAGYYGATIQPMVDSRDSPAKVALRIKAGPVYKIQAFDIDYRPQADYDSPQTAEQVGLKPDSPAQAETMLAAVEHLRELLRQRGYPASQISEQTFTVDHQAQTLSARLVVDLGPEARFGEVQYEGLERVKESYLRSLIPWPPGTRWDASKLEDYRRTLLSSGLFDSITISAPPPTTAGENVPISVRVREADQRSLGAGTSYSTSLGPSVNAYWEHRNLLGEAETFKTEAEWGQSISSLSSTLTKPNFWRRGQSGTASAVLSEESLDAYDKTALALAASLTRPLNRQWRASVGATFDQASITDTDGQHDSSLIGAPLGLRYDGTSDLLDPRSGFKLSASVTPYTGFHEGPVTFVSSRLDGSAYLPLDEAKDYVFAVRGGVGSILGGSRTSVPADKRFYAGGGGSVRGYGYQLAGDVDSAGDPVGGKSVIETGFELRMKLTDSIGLVPFVEGGRAFDGNQPDFGQGLLWGAGLGVRYYSPVGPVRLDVAMPLDRRPGVDNAWQLYVSLGQAF